MLDLILLGKRAAGETWSAELEQQLCYELKTFLLAGHETSASMLTLTLLEVLHDPTHSQRILEEAAAVLGPPGSPRVRIHTVNTRLRHASLPAHPPALFQPEASCGCTSDVKLSRTDQPSQETWFNEIT